MKKYSKIALFTVLAIAVIAVSFSLFSNRQKPKNINTEVSKANSAEMTSTIENDNKNGDEVKIDEPVQKAKTDIAEKEEPVKPTTVIPTSSTANKGNTSVNKQPESSQPKSQEPAKKPQPAKPTPKPSQPTPKPGQPTKPTQPTTPSSGVAGNDPVANAKWIANNLGFYNNNAGCYYNPDNAAASLALITVGHNNSNTSIYFRMWGGKVDSVSKGLLKFYLPNDYIKLYNMLNAWNDGSDAYTGKHYTLDSRDVVFYWYESSGRLQVVIGDK